MRFVFSDGGRARYYKASNVRDCVCRSLSIVTGKDYKEVYDIIKSLTNENPRNGLSKKAVRCVCEYFGGTWFPLMHVGSGCKVHLSESELPSGRLICSLSRHLTCVVDGVLYDTFDCSRNGSRCVYGYWLF